MKITTALLSLCLGLFSVSAMAHEDHAWLCELEFTAEAEGIQIIIGTFDIEGSGTLKCVNPSGDMNETNVNISIGGRPIAPRIGLGSFTIRGLAVGVELHSESPSDMLGDYAITSGRVAFGHGIGAFAATCVDHNSIKLQVGVEVLDGVGFEAGLTSMSITAVD